MDNALQTRLDLLLARRGDPIKGLGDAIWASSLEGVPVEELLPAAIAVVRELLLPDWAGRRVEDLRPQKALDAAEAWLADPSDLARERGKEASKACTEARNETFGTDHRVPEAARAVVRAAGGNDAFTSLSEAFSCAEQELLGRIALTAQYHLIPAQRAAIVAVLKRFLLEPQEPKQEPVDTGPVPYSPKSRFVMGQTLTHVTFGSLSVIAVGEKHIDVTLPNGTTKRLAHKPPG